MMRFHLHQISAQKKTMDAPFDTKSSASFCKNKRFLRTKKGSFFLRLGGLFLLCLFGAFLLPARAASKGPRTLIAGKSCLHGGCHQAQQQGPYTHGTKQKPLCTSCHKQTKPNLHRFMPKQGASCAQCHKKYSHQHPHRKTWSFVHGPVAVDACGTCHDPHRSRHKHLLKKSGNQLCFNCHQDVVRGASSQKVQHKPWKKHRCLSCHSPHGSRQQALMRGDVAQVCLSCHSNTKGQLARQHAHHGALLQGRKCLNCHTGHASTHKALLREPMSSLCLGCHDQAVPRYGHRKLADIQASLQRKFLHGPLKKGRCQDCHAAHGTSHAKLLTKAHPQGLYASFSEKKYGLCFSCHGAALASEKQTLSETSFRNGALNLHWLHVNRQKGRSCKFCHDAHSTQQAHLVRRGVTFGGWWLPLGYQASTEGGTCKAACHQAQSYHRKKPVLQGYERYRQWLFAPASWQGRTQKQSKPKPRKTSKKDRSLK